MTRRRDPNDYLAASPEEREIIREKRALMSFGITGKIHCVCIYCGAPFTEQRNARRHEQTSKRCQELRRGGPNA